MSESIVKIWKKTDVSANEVALLPYIASPDNNTKIAVIVCPGGSYFWKANKTEGTGVAEWLQRNGISAFVLNYRSAGWFSFMTYSRAVFHGHQHPDMIMDLQRSIQLVRENATKYGIDVNKIGVMGFSAGGHLVMSAAEFFETNFLSDVGITPKVSLRPDFVVPVYPVVTFVDKRYVHKRSMRGLLGDSKKQRQACADSMSLEKHVHPNTPPVFLVNCKDDPIVKYQNSELLDSALTAQNINHVYFQYKTGGHGFGATASKTTKEAIAWKEEFLKWIKTIW